MNKITTERHYKITFQDGSTYYGRTTSPGNIRYNDHLYRVRKGKHRNKHIQEVYDKYGYDDWVHKWLSTETGDLDYHNKIEFGYVQADPKSINIKKGYHALLSEEEQNKKTYSRRKQNRTPEEHQIFLSEQREHYHEVKSRMTPEELKEFKKKESLKYKRKKQNMTPEELEEHRRKDREYHQRRQDEKKRGGDNK